MSELKWENPSAVAPAVFEELPKDVYENVISSAIARRLPRGYEIFRVGEPQASISLLIEGLVKVVEVDVKGNEIILWLNAPGQFVGSLGFAPGAIHSSTARVVRPGEVLAWTWPAFQRILERFPEVTRIMQRMMARQAAELSSRICEVSTLLFPVRLARTLVRLALQIGKRTNGCVEIRLTQEMLSQMTASTVCNVNHQLAWWERQGMVARGRGAVLILDLPALEKLGQETR